MERHKTKHVASVTVNDPDTGHEVEIEVRKDITTDRWLGRSNGSVYRQIHLGNRAKRRDMSVTISEELQHFFGVEIRNENEGGTKPATLDGAQGSWDQAPDDVLVDWLGLERKYGQWDEMDSLDKVQVKEIMARVELELGDLIEALGGGIELVTLLPVSEQVE